MIRLSNIWFALSVWLAVEATAAEPVRYQVSATAYGGAGKFAPYYTAANRFGRLTQRMGLQCEGKLWKPLDQGRRTDWAFGADVVSGVSSRVTYQRYDAAAGMWHDNGRRPTAIWIQQLYGEVKYRSIDVTLGMKERGSVMLDDRLSSGDLTESANARPIAQLRVGLIDFQDVPLTSGLLQVEGAVAYGKYTDDGWWHDHFNYYYYHIARGQWYVYRRMYLRTAPGNPLSVTFGVQAATQFGGTTEQYWGGRLTGVLHRGAPLRDFVKALLPLSRGTEDFRIGNTLGSVDIMARYRLKTGSEIKLYLQNPWEDGSGLGKLNGYDGLWGIEYRNGRRGVVTAVVAEYLDMTNQSGPIHWAPGYVPGTDITAEATGADDYYNNAYYNSYANYGMLMGSPMVMSPLYNVDGYPAVTANRMRGVHAGAEGSPTGSISYRVLAGYRKAWGSGYVPLLKPVHSLSAMVEVEFAVRSVKGLSVTVQGAIDRGNLPCNATGMTMTVCYSGELKTVRQ